ncbi:hypothetical protein G6F32_016552 [Rhizopus arrhizus]|nr:hypothetical protein G6F32_016552 [Rhizopus arrhizus]
MARWAAVTPGPFNAPQPGGRPDGGDAALRSSRLRHQDAVNAACGTGDVQGSTQRWKKRCYSYWIVNVACPLATPAPTVPAWVCT